MVLPHDDEDLMTQSILIRHINRLHHVYFDENRQGNRIKSAAFSHSSGDPNYGMSVDLGQLLQEEGFPDDYMVPEGFGAVKLGVGDVRALGLPVGSDPRPHNRFHGQVWKVKETKRLKLQNLVIDWVVRIPEVDLR